MCTDFCICEGTPDDEHYKAYKAIPEATYNKYGRTFEKGFDGEINLQRNQSEDTPLFWAYDPEDGKVFEPNKKLASNNLMECFDKMNDIVDAYGKKLIDEKKKELGENYDEKRVQKEIDDKKAKFKS